VKKKRFFFSLSLTFFLFFFSSSSLCFSCFWDDLLLLLVWLFIGDYGELVKLLVAPTKRTQKKCVVELINKHLLDTTYCCTYHSKTCFFTISHLKTDSNLSSHHDQCSRSSQLVTPTSLLRLHTTSACHTARPSSTCLPDSCFLGSSQAPTFHLPTLI